MYILDEIFPKTSLLDIRSEGEFHHKSVINSANIPYSELEERMHELPDKSEVIHIVSTSPLSDEAITLLNANDRHAITCDKFEYCEYETWKPCRLWEPKEFLKVIIQQIPKGQSLDLGCGSGRDSVYLNLSGWQVTGIDRLPEAINRARNLEMNSKELLIEKKLIDKNIQDIRWIVADIENEDNWFTGEYSLITSFFYLDRDVLKKVKNNLITGGSLCIETFTPTHREKHGKPKRDAFLAFPNELPTLFPEFEILHYDEAWRGDKHTARLWAVKK